MFKISCEKGCQTPELIYANLDGEVKGFKNPTIEIVEKAIRLALPRIS